MEGIEYTRALPVYSPATDTPDYTREPRPDEERLDISGRVPSAQERTGVFVETSKHLTLALTHQLPHCREPTYGRGEDALVRGALTLLKPEGVLSVDVTLEGVIDIELMTSVMMDGSTMTPLFSKKQILFQKLDPPATQPFPKRPSLQLGSSSSIARSHVHAERCPSILAFSLRLPVTYIHNGIPRALPPSYSVHIGSVPALRRLLVGTNLNLDVRYTLRVVINKRGPLGMDKKITATQPIVFLPRSRPAQPALPPSLTFLSTLKSSPEEWKLFEAESAVRDGHEGSPVIHSALLLPRSQIFPLGHCIPFHLQISCASANTLAPYSHIPSLPAHPSGLHSRLHSLPKDLASKAILSFALPSGRINISVQRHITVEVLGRWLQLKKRLSTSTFKRCLIDMSVPRRADIPTLAWEGQLEILQESRCGGFGGPGVRVQDYILLSIIPPDSEHSALQEIHHLIPIRLTTDPYEEDVPVSSMERHHTEYA